MKVECSEYIVEAIIRQTATDYKNSVKKLDKYRKELEKRKSNPKPFRKRREGESIHVYANKKYRESVGYIETKIIEETKQYNSSINFFMNDIKFFTSMVDGEKLLEILDKELLEEGYEV